MSLIAKKPCKFGGRKFYIGEEIPEKLVKDANRQEQLGTLTITSDAGAELEEVVETLDVILSTDDGEGTVSIALTQEELQTVFDVMQKSAADAAEAIGTVESENVLIAIHAADSRSTVKKAAEKRADVLNTAEAAESSSTGTEEATEAIEDADEEADETTEDDEQSE